MNIKGHIKFVSSTAIANVATDTGAADAYVVSLAEAPAAYTTGLVVWFKAVNANTGTSTINVNSLGVQTIKKNVDVDLAAGDIKAGQVHLVVYDGTNFQLASWPGTGGGVQLDGTNEWTGLNTFSALNWYPTLGLTQDGILGVQSDGTVHWVELPGKVTVATVSTTTTVSPTKETVYLVDASGGNRTVTFDLSAVAGTGIKLHFKKTDSSANTVTIDADGTDTIDGGTTAIIRKQNESVTIVSNGTAWYVI